MSLTNALADIKLEINDKIDEVTYAQQQLKSKQDELEHLKFELELIEQALEKLRNGHTQQS